MEFTIDDNTDEKLVEEICNSFPQDMEENPELITFMSLCVLKFENYEIEPAIKRLGRYLKWRRRVFGDVKDHSLTDAVLARQIATCFIQVCPIRCANGEAFIYMEPSRHDPSTYSSLQTVKCCHYMMLTSLKKDPRLCQTGSIVLINVSNIGLKNVDLGVPPIMIDVVDCMPLKLIHGIIYDPPTPIRLVMPVVMAILPDHLKGRIHVVVDLVTELNELGIPITMKQLPVVLGGQWKGFTCEEQRLLYTYMNATA